MTKYEALAKELTKQIADGQFKPNTKLPSIRSLCERHALSMSTVVRAMEILEQDEVIHARARSGFYVSAKSAKANTSLAPEPVFVLESPKQIDTKDLVLGLIKSRYTPNTFNLGAAIPAQKFLPKKDLDRASSIATKKHSEDRDKYQIMPGNPALRKQISRLMQDINCDVLPEQILITSGCQEAVFLSLLTCCKRGGTVAVETPTYPGFLQVCEAQGIEVIEVPTSPSTGISIGALELAIQQWDIDVVMLSSSYSNPSGARMPSDKKKTLLGLCERNNIRIIEDDVYADLSHDPFYRPRPIKSYDTSNTVIYCSSFSKTVSPGLRVGWVVNAELQHELEYAKYVSGLSVVTLSQDILAEYLALGRYERYLQSARRTYSQQANTMAKLIEDLMPEGTRITQPNGGFILWVALPNEIDTLSLLDRTLKRAVSFYPGCLFSATNKFNNCLRVNCALDFDDPRLTNALKVVFEEAHKMLDGC